MLKIPLRYLLFLFITSASYAQQKSIDSLLHLLPKAKEDTNKVNILNALSNSAIGISDYKGAIAYANKAIELSVKLNFKKGQAAAYHYIGNAHYYQNDYPGSIVYYLKCLDIKEQWLAEHPDDIEIKKSIANACNDLGYTYDYLSNYPKALFYYLKCLKIAEEIGYKEAVVSAYSNIGSVYDYQGEFDKALEYDFKAVKMNQELGRKSGLGISYNNIGNVYFHKGNFYSSLKYHKLGLSVKRQTDDDLAIAASLNNIGSVFTAFYDLPSDSLKKYFPEFKKLETIPIKDQLLDSAEVYLKEGLELCKKQKSEYGMMQVYKSLGTVLFKKGKSQEALDQYLKALAIGDKLKTQKELYESYRDMAEISNKLGKYSDAFQYQKLYSELKDTVLNEAKQKDLGRQEARFEYDKELLAKQKEQEKKDAIAMEEKRRQNIIIAGVSLVAILLMVFAIFILRSYRQKQKANIEITRQKVIIEEKNREVHDSITYAKRIQNAILPNDKLIKQFLPDSFVLFKPKDIVSGDFYWMENIGNKILFAAVDCTGHGVPGAMVSVVGHNGLNRAVKEFGLTQPAAILDKLTALVEETFSKSESDVKDGMDISLCSLDSSTNILEWSGANNPVWIIRSEKMEKITADKQPIGVFEHRKPFTNHSIQLNKGDSIYIFTDGYADQFGGPKGKKFKYKQLEELILSGHDKSMNEQKELLDRSFETWKGRMEQVDDLCIIGVRI